MGNHLILDFVGVAFDLNNYELLDGKLREVLSCTSVHIEGSLHKKFEPQGVTILYLLSESHFSIHTWPELGLAAVDAFMCGEARAELAVAWLQAALGAAACAPHVIQRGG